MTWWWFARLHARSTVFGAVFAAAMSFAMAQSPIATYGYSRATLPGIPGDKKGTQGKDFFLSSITCIWRSKREAGFLRSGHGSGGATTIAS